MNPDNIQVLDCSIYEDLSLIKETLAISAHILTQDPAQLASQLTGRLLDKHSETLQRLLAGARSKEAVWLRPLSASLEKAGGARYRTLIGHTSVVNSLAVSNDSKLIFSASSDRTVRVWDISLGYEIAILQGFPCGVESLALTPNGEWILVGLYDGTIQVLDWRSSRLIAIMSGHSKGVTAITCTTDGHIAVSSSTDTTLIVWDLRSFSPRNILRGHTGVVNDLVITPQEDIVISASSDKTLRVWNMRSGRELGCMESSWGQYAVDITPDGHTLISGSEMVPITWDFFSLTRKAILTSFTGPYHETTVDGIAISPDGHQFVSASDDLKVWNLSDGNPMTTWATHQASVSDVVITPNGRWAVSASYDKTIKVWNLFVPETISRTSKSTASGNPVKWIGFGPQQEVISLGIGYKRGEFGEDAEWESMLRLPDKYIDWNYRVKDIAQSSDRNTLLFAVGNGLDVIDIPSWTHAPQGLFGIRSRIALSQDDRIIASFNWSKNMLEVWNRRTGQSLISVPDMRNIEAIAITQDRHWVIAGTLEGDVLAWNLLDSRQRSFPKAHTSRVHQILANQSGDFITCGDDGFIYAWNLDQGEKRFSLELSWKKTLDLKLSANGNRLVAVSDKGAVECRDFELGELLLKLPEGSVKVNGVWNTEITGKPLSNLVLMKQREWMIINNGVRISILDVISGKELASFNGDSEFETISLSPDESTIVVGTTLGEIHQLAIEANNV